jgi:hypothetical protein
MAIGRSARVGAAGGFARRSNASTPRSAARRARQAEREAEAPGRQGRMCGCNSATNVARRHDAPEHYKAVI